MLGSVSFRFDLLTLSAVCCVLLVFLCKTARVVSQKLSTLILKIVKVLRDVPALVVVLYLVFRKEDFYGELLSARICLPRKAARQSALTISVSQALHTSNAWFFRPFLSFSLAPG